jgi:hypothetical protein
MPNLRRFHAYPSQEHPTHPATPASSVEQALSAAFGGVLCPSGRHRKLRNFLCFALLWAVLCPSASIAQNQYTIGPPANPAAKLRAAEKAAADKRMKENEKREECRKQAAGGKIAPRDRKSFVLSCEKNRRAAQKAAVNSDRSAYRRFFRGYDTVSNGDCSCICHMAFPARLRDYCICAV